MAVSKSHLKLDTVCLYGPSMRRTELLSFLGVGLAALGILVSILIVVLHIDSETRTAARVERGIQKILDTLQSAAHSPPSTAPASGSAPSN